MKNIIFQSCKWRIIVLQESNISVFQSKFHIYSNVSTELSTKMTRKKKRKKKKKVYFTVIIIQKVRTHTHSLYSKK